MAIKVDLPPGFCVAGLLCVRRHGACGLLAYEGRAFSWWTSVYWTLVTMSTLGYGDITFHSD